MSNEGILPILYSIGLHPPFDMLVGTITKRGYLKRLSGRGLSPLVGTEPDPTREPSKRQGSE
jgi:hypothetical protein